MFAMAEPMAGFALMPFSFLFFSIQVLQLQNTEHWSAHPSNPKGVEQVWTRLPSISLHVAFNYPAKAQFS